jgi:hypothetical protein
LEYLLKPEKSFDTLDGRRMSAMEFYIYKDERLKAKAEFYQVRPLPE